MQRNMTARPASFDEADAELTALITGIRPVLLLIKQVDQGGALNGRLLSAGGSPRTFARSIGPRHSSGEHVGLAVILASILYNLIVQRA
jgi:hypothetical protein